MRNHFIERAVESSRLQLLERAHRTGRVVVRDGKATRPGAGAGLVVLLALGAGLFVAAAVWAGGRT